MGSIVRCPCCLTHILGRGHHDDDDMFIRIGADCGNNAIVGLRQALCVRIFMRAYYLGQVQAAALYLYLPLTPRNLQTLS